MDDLGIEVIKETKLLGVLVNDNLMQEWDSFINLWSLFLTGNSEDEFKPAQRDTEIPGSVESTNMVGELETALKEVQETQEATSLTVETSSENEPKKSKKKLYKTIVDHLRLYKIIQDYRIPDKTIQDHSRPCETI